MKGIYQHCKEKHLHRYLSEFDFSYSNRSGLGVEDTARNDRALKGIRLTYRRPDQEDTAIEFHIKAKRFLRSRKRR